MDALTRGPETDPSGDAVKPAGERLASANRMGVSDQGQKGGLKGVVGIAAATENPAAHAEDHRPVPPDENLEGGRIVMLGKAAEQFVIGEMGQAFASGNPAEMMNEIGKHARIRGLHSTAVLPG